MTPVTRSYLESAIAALEREAELIRGTIVALKTLVGGVVAEAPLALTPAPSDVVVDAEPAPGRRRRGGRRPKGAAVVVRTRRRKQATRPAVRRSGVKPAETSTAAPSSPPEARKPARAAGSVGGDGKSAPERREQLLALLDKSPVGLTIVELRQHTPRMDPKDRQNALSVLKSTGEIRRAGNTWMRVRANRVEES